MPPSTRISGEPRSPCTIRSAPAKWRARPTLTISAGLRWEDFGILSADNNNLLSNLDANRNLVLVGSPTLKRLYNRDLDNFGPRLGWAWTPLAGTVIRASHGVYYDYIPQDMLLENDCDRPLGTLPG